MRAFIAAADADFRVTANRPIESGGRVKQRSVLFTERRLFKAGIEDQIVRGVCIRRGRTFNANKRIPDFACFAKTILALQFVQQLKTEIAVRIRIRINAFSRQAAPNFNGLIQSVVCCQKLRQIGARGIVWRRDPA